MDFNPDHWLGVLQLGLYLSATVGALIMFVALILIGLNSRTTTEQQEEQDHDHGDPR
jgi:hypothetical protein